MATTTSGNTSEICLQSGDYKCQTHPHQIIPITKGEKFFIRNFISYLYDGTKEWLDKQKYYGAYKWGKMESARVEKEGEHSMKYILSDNENNILEVK